MKQHDTNVDTGRRRFCRLAALAVAAMSVPRVAHAAGTRHDSGERLPDSGRCRLRVVRCHCFTDLQSHYLSDPEAGGCTAFTPGQEIGISAADIAAVDSSGTLHGVKICPLAWQVLRPHIISTLRASAGDSSASTTDLCTESTDGSILLCCPSGTRPVTFAIASV